MDVELIREGLRDAADGIESIPALLVLTAAPALRDVGVDVPDVAVPDHRLYEIVAADCGDGAHSHYNALLRSIVRATRAVRYAAVTRRIVREGRADFYHYDFYSQCLTRIERGYDNDVAEAQRMVDEGLVQPRRLRDLFDAIEPRLIRYPVIHPPAFRRAVEAFLARQ